MGLFRKTRIIAAGKFDVLHAGHIKYLEDAKRLGGRRSELIVIIARDSTIEKSRGSPPVFPEDQRLIIVQSLKPVDKAILGYENTDKYQIIFDLKPDIIALGYDQPTNENELDKALKARKINAKIIRLKKWGNDNYAKSSRIRERVINIEKKNHK